ncbi:MAG TPA: hypothetical protein PLP73_04225, partial [Candidatus Absconditabacterales bacterium]|nr:hypothetical protein [Candidatus Absconditabacterales bacterium]
MATLEELMGKLVESQIKTNESLENLTGKIDDLLKQKGSDGVEYTSTTNIDIRSMELEPERVTKKFRIMYVMNKPLYADKNNSAPDMGFVSDAKGTRNFDSKEEA